jgi:hypothetical protein
VNREEKQKRLEKVNQIIQTISEVGRKFFRYKEVSRFEIDARGKIWFVDGYRGKRIYAHYKHSWRGFSEGGTLMSICKEFVDYIRKGTLLHPRTFGPFASWVCDGDPWGYRDDMEIVRKKAVELGILAEATHDQA